MIVEKFPEIQSLPDEDKLRLASELWESVAGGGGSNVDPELAALLDQRWADYQANPEAVVPWAEVKARLKDRCS